MDEEGGGGALQVAIALEVGGHGVDQVRSVLPVVGDERAQHPRHIAVQVRAVGRLEQELQHAEVLEQGGRGIRRAAGVHRVQGLPVPGRVLGDGVDRRAHPQLDAAAHPPGKFQHVAAEPAGIVERPRIGDDHRQELAAAAVPGMQAIGVKQLRHAAGQAEARSFQLVRS
jgi:hypothetical protein